MLQDENALKERLAREKEKEQAAKEREERVKRALKEQVDVVVVQGDTVCS